MDKSSYLILPCDVLPSERRPHTDPMQASEKKPRNEEHLEEFSALCPSVSPGQRLKQLQFGCE